VPPLVLKTPPRAVPDAIAKTANAADPVTTLWKPSLTTPLVFACTPSFAFTPVVEVTPTPPAAVAFALTPTWPVPKTPAPLTEDPKTPIPDPLCEPQTPEPLPFVPAFSPRTPAESAPGAVGLTWPTTPKAPLAVDAVSPCTPGEVPVTPECRPCTPVPVPLNPSTARPLRTSPQTPIAPEPLLVTRSCAALLIVPVKRRRCVDCVVLAEVEHPAHPGARDQNRNTDHQYTDKTDQDRPAQHVHSAPPR
jgi:hypothetical protein